MGGAGRKARWSTEVERYVVQLPGNDYILRSEMERLSIPPEFSNYAEEKGIFTLYEGMLHALLVARPEDPLQFLSQYLSVNREKSKQLANLHM